jgi:prephenate dehydrogenase
MRIAIIGGYGAMGRWLISQIKGIKGVEIFISGPNELVGKKYAKEEGIEYFKDNKEASKDADVVVISVPIQKTVDVIKEVAPGLKSGALLTDMTSVKVKPINAMLKYAPKDVEIIGAHPIFGPDTPSFNGQVVVLVPVRTRFWLQKVKKFLERKGAIVVITTAEEHDKIMSIVQGLTHYSMIVFGGVMKEQDADVKTLRRFSSPIYRALIPIVYRVVAQDVHAHIQIHNPFIKDVHESFIKQAQAISRLVKSLKANDLIEYMRDVRKHFASSEGADSILLDLSRQVVSSVEEQRKELEALAGSRVCLINTVTGKAHIGILKDISSDTITIEESKKKKVTLNAFNVRIATKDEEIRIRKERFGETFRDYSIIIPEGLDESLILDLIKIHVPQVYPEVIDSYKGYVIPKGFKSVTIRLRFLKDEDSEEIQRVSESLFLRLGATIR